MTKPVDRPHKKPGRRRIYARDSLSKTKRGKNAVKKIADLRIKALRSKANHPKAQTLKGIEMRNADRPLTDKQRMFVRFWAAGETPRTAAIMAGFSETSAAMGWKLSHDPAILKIYHEEKKLFEAAAQMTRQKVMDMLKDAYDMAKIQSDPSVMVAAAREIGKMCGYYEPETRININIGAKIDQLNNMSDEQLLKLIEEQGDVLPGEAIRIDEEPALLEAPK